MPKKAKSRKGKKLFWFSSTIFILSLAFITLFSISWLKYGLGEAIDIVIKYGTGMTATAIFIAILGFIFRNPIRKLLKKI